MSDYSFLKSGIGNSFSDADTNTDPLLVKAYTSVFLAFTEFGLKHAGDYVVGKGRKLVTVDDIKRGMKYEVFQFMERHDSLETIEKWKNILDEEINDELESDYDEDDDEYDDKEEVEQLELIGNQVDTTETEAIDKVFMSEMDNIDEQWSKWVPQNIIEESLMRRINEMQ